MKQPQIKTNLSLPWLKPLAKTFPNAEVFLVGGMVRDILLKRESKDIDLVVRGVPMPKLIAFLKKFGNVDVVGKTFGVIKFAEKIRGGFAPAIDIALPRTEIAGGSGAYRDVAVNFQFDLPIEDDLSRRDFTINAMALNLATGALTDPFGGCVDLRAKKIRAVGKPATRFAEDYTRMLRALRFACQLNFTIEPATTTAIKKSIARVNDTIDSGERKVPYELIGRELVKSLVSNPVRCMELWDSFGAFKHVAPELLAMHKCPQPKNYHNEGDVWQHSVLALKNLHGAPYKKFIKKLPPIFNAPAVASPTQYVATMLHDVAKPLTIQTPKKDGVDRIRFTGHDTEGAKVARVIAERLKLSSVEGFNINTDLLVWLVEHHLLAVQADVRDMKETTIEKYFLRDIDRGRELLTMLFGDGSATIPSNKKDKKRHLDDVLARIRNLLKTRGGRQELPAALIDGNEIMAALKIAPGPRIGELLMTVREAQLSGKIKTKIQALAFLKK
ncbi:MAG: HD domain-containing protein [Candidatus Magasanikbacteria bacterium]|nr:HD domain-containing protein [Candidatus Magasanikbacteria bacterium]